MSNTQMEVTPQATGRRIVREPTTEPGYGAECMIEVLTEHAEHLTFKVNTLTHKVRDLEIARDTVETLAQRHPSRDAWRAAVAYCDQVCLEAQEMVYDTEPAEVHGPCMDFDSQPMPSCITLEAARERAGATLDNVIRSANGEPVDVATGIRRVAEVLADAMKGTTPAEIMESRARAFDATRYLLGLGPMGEI